MYITWLPSGDQSAMKDPAGLTCVMFVPSAFMTRKPPLKKRIFEPSGDQCG